MSNEKSELDPELVKAARIHRKSVKIIAKFLREIDPQSEQGIAERNAAAILARLAHANLLVEEV